MLVTARLREGQSLLKDVFLSHDLGVDKGHLVDEFRILCAEERVRTERRQRRVVTSFLVRNAGDQ